MTILLSLCFLFFVGSCLGWILEVLFRRFFSAKKWINPGFLTGPYLPLYGFGLVGLYGICQIPINTAYPWVNAIITIAIMGVAMTLIEYVTGLIFIRGMKIKLWDYSDRFGNIQGIICPLFSLFWTAIGAFYYFVIDPFVISWVEWFVSNMAFAFVVGFFFGVFAIDLAHSINLLARISRFAKERGIVVAYEKFKENIKDRIERVTDGVKDGIERATSSAKKKRASFLHPFKSDKSLEQSLDDYVKDNEASNKNVSTK